VRPIRQSIGPSPGRGGRGEGPIQGVTKEALWLENRIGSALAEDRDADGDVADQDPGDGAQGGGDPPAGVQPDPGDHGRGGAGRGGEAAEAQLLGRVAYRPVVRGGPPVRPGADRGGPAAAVGVDRSEARGRSPGPLRAARGEASAEAVSAAEAAAEGSQTVDQTRHKALREGIGSETIESSTQFCQRKELALSWCHSGISPIAAILHAKPWSSGFLQLLLPWPVVTVPSNERFLYHARLRS